MGQGDFVTKDSAFLLGSVAVEDSDAIAVPVTDPGMEGRYDAHVVRVEPVVLGRFHDDLRERGPELAPECFKVVSSAYQVSPVRFVPALHQVIDIRFHRGLGFRSLYALSERYVDTHAHRS